MSSRFAYLRALAVTNSFDHYAQAVLVSDSSMCAWVQGIYRRNPSEQQAGELTLYGTGPTVRLRSSDIEYYCIGRGSIIAVDDVEHTVVLPLVDNQDGTHIVSLSEVKPHVD